MRNLVNLEGTIVPASQAYGEVFKNMGKKTAMYLGAFVLFHVGRGFVIGIKKARNTQPEKYSI